MIVIVALAAPYYSLTVCKFMTENAYPVDVFIMTLIYKRTHTAIRGREFKDTVILMPALIIFKRHSAAVGVPFKCRKDQIGWGISRWRGK